MSIGDPGINLGITLSNTECVFSTIRQPIMIMRADANGDIVVTATKEQIVENMKCFGGEYNLLALMVLRIEELERKLAEKL